MSLERRDAVDVAATATIETKPDSLYYIQTSTSKNKIQMVKNFKIFNSNKSTRIKYTIKKITLVLKINNSVYDRIKVCFLGKLK